MIKEYLKSIDKIKDLLKYLFSPFDSFFNSADSLVAIIFSPLKPLSDMIDNIIKWIYKQFQINK